MSKPLLEFDESRPAVAPRDAATIVVVRDGSDGPEVFCVERNKKSRFLGGAIVFPGGKLDDADRSETWRTLATPPQAARDGFAPDDDTLRALAIAALRETLEEAALLVSTQPPATDDEVTALRAALSTDASALARYLEGRGARLDAASLRPLARWVTPEAETRRYDTRFFVAVAPEGQRGAHDMHETMASFWATPRSVLARFEAREVQLAPPTHRTLEVLAEARSVDEVLAIADAARLSPICPKLTRHEDTLALALPGDPAHSEPRRISPHATRYALRGEHWIPVEAPRDQRP